MKGWKSCQTTNKVSLIVNAQVEKEPLIIIGSNLKPTCLKNYKIKDNDMAHMIMPTRKLEWIQSLWKKF